MLALLLELASLSNCVGLVLAVALWGMTRSTLFVVKVLEKGFCFIIGRTDATEATVPYDELGEWESEGRLVLLSPPLRVPVLVVDVRFVLGRCCLADWLKPE